MRFELARATRLVFVMAGAVQLASCSAGGEGNSASEGGAGGDASTDAPQQSSEGSIHDATAPDGTSQAEAASGDGDASKPDASQGNDKDGSVSGDGATCAGPVLQGSFTIQNSIDLASLTPYSEITGDLVFNVSGLTSISLPHLCKVDGFVQGTATGLTTLDLPALTTVTGFGMNNDMVLGLTLTALTTLNAPSLRSAPNGIGFDVGPGASIDFSSLTGTIATILVSNGMYKPRTSLNAPMPMTSSVVDLYGVDAKLGLTLAGAITVIDSSLDAPALTNAATLTVSDSLGSTPLSLPALATVTGDIKLTGLTASPTLSSLRTIGTLQLLGTNLTSLSLPALTSGWVALGGNPVASPAAYSTCSVPPNANPNLVALVVPNWTSGVVIFWDSAFPKCRADAVEAQLGITPSDARWGEICMPLASSPCP